MLSFIIRRKSDEVLTEGSLKPTDALCNTVVIWLQGAPLLRGKSVLSCKFDVKLGVHFIKVKLIKKAKSPHLHLVILSTQGNDCRLMVMVTVMVTLFIHGKSLSKYYKMVQEQLIIPN